MTERWDETWHRLQAWTNGQAQSERLSAQILLSEGFTRLDPSHPLGGKDGGKDAICRRDGLRWVMASYFPRGQQDFKTIEAKFMNDLASASTNDVHGIAFVTNQELRQAERRELTEAANLRVELYHLERLTAILDQPSMASVRKQFLQIGDSVGQPAESSCNAFLDQIVDSLSGASNNGGGHLYLVARPSRKTEDLLRSISRDYLGNMLHTASSSEIFPHDFSPLFVAGQIRNNTRGRVIHMGNHHKLDLEVGYDGDMRLFCSRAVEGKQILDYGVAETTVRFLYFAGCLYQEAQYFETCDLGVAITGLLGAESATTRVRWDRGLGQAFEEPSYRRTIQAAARSMVGEPKVQANRLLERFFNVLGERLNPLV